MISNKDIYKLENKLNFLNEVDDFEKKDLEPNMTSAMINDRNAEYHELSRKIESLRLMFGHLQNDRVKELTDKANNFLNDDQMNKIVNFIKTHCNKFLQTMILKKRFLYRGVKPNHKDNYSNPALVFQGSSALDRKPLHSRSEPQKYFDKALDQMGIKAKRSNSIFTTSEIGFARGFGTTYLIFPFDSANFSWSLRDKDVILDNDSLLSMTDINIPEDEGKLLLQHKNILQSEFDKFINSELGAKLEQQNSYGWHQFKRNLNRIYKLFDNSVPQQLIDVRTLNIYSKSSLALLSNIYEFDDSFYTIIQNSLNIIYNISSMILQDEHNMKINVEKIQERYLMTDENFETALEMGHEILINGNYMAVSYNLGYEKLKKAFF